MKSSHLPTGIDASVAGMLKDAYEAVSSFIEAYTQSVCPFCDRVCCIDRHGTRGPVDEAFLEALGEDAARLAPKPVDTDPCRYLGQGGCRLPRHHRPHRCTWYFCEPLLEAMPDDTRAYRLFLRGLERLQALRRAFLDEALSRSAAIKQEAL